MQCEGSSTQFDRMDYILRREAEHPVEREFRAAQRREGTAHRFDENIFDSHRHRLPPAARQPACRSSYKRV
jgi:hypothetical protein